MKHKRILIARTDRIGDVVLSTPLPREIKKKYPDSLIAVLVRSYTKAIYENNPYVDFILTDDYNQENKRKTFFSKISELRKYRFTDAIMLLPTERLNWMFFFAGIKNRIGVGHKFYQFITFIKSVHRHKYNPLRSEADYGMDSARKLEVVTDNLDTEIHLTEEERKVVQQKKKEFLGKKKYLIGIHSSSGNSAPNWHPLIYKNLITQLAEDEKFRLIVTDNRIPADLQNIQDVIYPNINVELREAILNIAALDYLISSSTGPMHLAAALKVSTISMFCPLTACSPELWGPKGNHSRILLPEKKYCNNVCPGDPKICSFQGEGGISEEAVIDTLNDEISKSE